MSLSQLSAIAGRETRINFGLWAAVAAACLLFRLDASALSADEVWYWRIWSISVLHWLLWQELIHYGAIAPPIKINAAGGIAFLAFFAAAALWMRPEFAYAFVLVLAVTLLATRSDTGRRLAICFILVVAAGITSSSLLASAHSFFAGLDARGLFRVLAIMGDEPVRQGSIVFIPSLDRGLSVDYVCSTTWVATLPMFTFVQVTILRHGEIVARDIKAMIGMFAAIWFLNIVRLVQMSPSQADYEYWHFGTGADIFSFATAFVMYLMLRPLEVREAAHVPT